MPAFFCWRYNYRICVCLIFLSTSCYIYNLHWKLDNVHEFHVMHGSIFTRQRILIHKHYSKQWKLPSPIVLFRNQQFLITLTQMVSIHIPCPFTGLWISVDKFFKKNKLCEWFYDSSLYNPVSNVCLTEMRHQVM